MGPPSVAEVKEEVVMEASASMQRNMGSVMSVGSVAPPSCQVTSVYQVSSECSVQLDSVSPATPSEAVGRGTKLLQFFYQNPQDDVRVGFVPVRVDTEEEVNGVVALVTEKAEEYNRKYGFSETPVQYLTSAVRARSLLAPEIVRHIERCFTKKGMKESRSGVKKRSYPRRKDVIKIASERIVKPEEEVEEEPAEVQDVKRVMAAEEEEEEEVEEDEEEEEEEDEVEEYVPTEEEMKGVLEERIFGGLMPKCVRRLKPPRAGVSERTGRGGRNEDVEGNCPENLVLGAVNYMLGNTEEGERPTLSLASLFGQFKKRRKKQKITVEDLENLDDEDDDYKGPGSARLYREAAAEDGTRKSRRIARRSGGEQEQEQQQEARSTGRGDQEASGSGSGEQEAIKGGEQEARSDGEELQEQVIAPLQKAEEAKKTGLEEVKKTGLEEAKLTVVNHLLAAKMKETSKDTFTLDVDATVEEEEGRPGSRMRRGRAVLGRGEGRLELGEGVEERRVLPEGVEEMLRASSSMSRPGSRADSRPDSQNSRPGSALPKKVARQLEGLGSPDRDSPVCAPRVRHLEKEARSRTNIDGRPSSSLGSHTQGRSPVRTALPCDNFLKNKQRPEDLPAASLETSSIDASLTSSFDQAFARGGKNQEKVKKMLEKIKKKAESRENKKYKGFGEKVECAEAKEARRREARERRREEMTVKKAAVSSAEASLMADLLAIGESAVAESRQAEVEEEQAKEQETASQVQQRVALVAEFEEAAGIMAPGSGSLSEQLDDLFEL